MINLAHRIRGLFGASQGAGVDGSLAPDPEWDELVAWAVALPGGRHDFDDDSALSFVRGDESDWLEALARAKARAFDEEAQDEAAQEPQAEARVLVAVPASADAGVTPAPAASEPAVGTWSEGLAQARARRLAEDAEWSACLQRAKASRMREEDDDAEWLACLQRAKADAVAAAADEEAEWLASLARAKAGTQPHAR